MGMKIIKVRALSNPDVYVGVPLTTGSYYTIPTPADQIQWGLDQKFAAALSSTPPTVAVNDGIEDLDFASARRLLEDRGLEDIDGRPIVHNTPRKFGLYTYYTSSGDNQADPSAVGGSTDPDNQLRFNMVSGTNTMIKYMDLNTVANETHIAQGGLQWINGLNDKMTLELVPRVTTYSAGSNTNYNLYGGYLIIPAAGDGTITVNPADMQLVEMPLREDGTRAAGYWNADYNMTTKQFENITAAPSGDGVYNMFGLEVCLQRFGNTIFVLGDGCKVLPSYDSSQLGHNIRIKVICDTNVSEVGPHSWMANVTLILHRKKTC